MTKKSAKKVVIINNLKGGEIEQAIFILRGKDEEQPECSIIDEANEIIKNYLRHTGITDETEKKRKWFKK